MPDDFDVVKKRRRMDAEGSVAGEGQTSGDALANFTDFESCTTSALLKSVQDDDTRARTLEVRLSEQQASGGSSPDSVGGVYVARSASIDAYKIGFTMRKGPWPRLTELSSLMPLPFQLVLWIPCSTPFKLEQMIHSHFAEDRISLRAVSTEFFKVEERAVRAYVASLALDCKDSYACSEVRSDGETDDVGSSNGGTCGCVVSNAVNSFGCV